MQSYPKQWGEKQPTINANIAAAIPDKRAAGEKKRKKKTREKNGN